jgi:transitional endoplasmic reticulum ATPase
MRFHVENFERHKEAGVQAHRAGKPAEARYHFLKAADSLYRAAAQSEGVLRKTRIANAKKLVRMARTIKDAPARSGAKVKAADEAETGRFVPLEERPAIRFGDIAGLEDAKQEIKLKMVYPFLYPEQAQRFLVQKGGGILLFGPPGTGKTMLARAVAGEIDAAFFTVRPSEIMSKWVGEAEKNVQALFESARSHDRSVIFLDEIEALIPARRSSGSTVMQRVVPQILSELEGFHKDEQNPLLFIGATNEPWSLDPAVLRPGRFDEKICIPLPDLDARRRILELNLERRPLADDVEPDALAQRLEGYSGADIRNICSKAANVPFLESIEGGEMRDIASADFEKVISTTPPSVSKKSLSKYDKYALNQ